MCVMKPGYDIFCKGLEKRSKCATRFYGYIISSSDIVLRSEKPGLFSIVHSSLALITIELSVNHKKSHI